MGHLNLSNLSIPEGSNLSIPEVDDRWQLRSYVTDEYVISSIKSTSFFRLLNSKQGLLNNEKDQHMREILNEVFSTNNRDNQKFRHISIKKIKQVPNWEIKCNNILKEIMKEHRPFGSSRGFHVFKFHNLYNDFIIRITRDIWAQNTINKYLTPRWLEYYYSPNTGCGFKKSKTRFEVLQKGSNQRQISKSKGKAYTCKVHVNNYILIHILSFIPSYYFYKVTKSELLWRNYFGFKPEDKFSLSLIREYVLLDYFLNRRHLLLLDEWKPFRIQFNEHYRPHCYGYQSIIQDTKKTRQKDVSIESVQTSIESVKNIARLTYFISCLRRIELHRRKCTKDKMEQTNIGMSFKILIDAVSKQSEIELEMIRAV